MDERSEGADPGSAPATDSQVTPAAPPGRAARGPDEGPAPGGGSALDTDDEAAEEEIGGGD